MIRNLVWNKLLKEFEKNGVWGNSEQAEPPKLNAFKTHLSPSMDL